MSRQDKCNGRHLRKETSSCGNSVQKPSSRSGLHCHKRMSSSCFVALRHKLGTLSWAFHTRATLKPGLSRKWGPHLEPGLLVLPFARMQHGHHLHPGLTPDHNRASRIHSVPACLPSTVTVGAAVQVLCWCHGSLGMSC